MKRFIHGLVLLVLCIVTHQANSSTEQTATTPLVAVLGEDSYPFQFVDDQGMAAGLLVDLWNEWSRVTQTPIVFVARHWPDSLEQLKSGKADIHLGMAKTDLRQIDFEFAEPIAEVNTNLYVNKQIVGKTQLHELLPYQIGIVEGSSHEEELVKRQPGLSFKRYQGRESLFNAVLNGELLVFAGMEGYLRDASIQHDISAQFPVSSRILIKKSQLFPAVHKGNTALVALINRGFSQIPPKYIQLLERRWLGYERHQSGLTIAMQLGVEPYVDIGIDGLPHGLFVDMWHLWSEKTGIDIDFIPGDMNGSLDDVKRGIADVHIGYPESDDMNTGMARAWHLYSVKSRLFVFGKPIVHLDELANQRIGVVPTSPYLAKLKAQLPNVELRFYDNVAAMVKAARNGDIAGFVAAGAWTQHYLLLNKSWTDFYQYPEMFFTTDIFSLTRTQDTGLLNRINSGFKLISYQEFADIEKKWMLNPSDHIFTETNQKLVLPDAQRKYLDTLGELKVGYLKQWPPMEFMDEYGEFAGINSDVMKLIGQQLGVPLKAIAFDDWQNLMLALRNGTVDLIGSIASTPERAGQLHFSETYWPSPWALATELDKPAMFSLEQLTGQRVALVEGYHLVSTLISQQPGINLVLVADTEAGLAAVSSGKADVFIDKVLTLASALQTGAYPSLKLSLMSDLTEERSHIGINLNYARLVPLVNEVLGQLDSRKQQQIQQRWAKFSIAQESSQYQLWFKYILLGIVILSVIVIIMVLINRRLTNEISRRKAVEQQIKHLASHDVLTQLPNRGLLDDRLSQALLTHQRERAKFAILFIDLDNFKMVNDQWGHNAGDSLLVQFSQRLQQVIRRSDTVARFGGDEFIVLLNHIQSQESVCQVADNLLKVLSQPVRVADQDILIAVSIGIAIYPHDGNSVIELLKKADKLMYNAKQTGGNRYCCG